jgi:hypothetical protein
MVFACCAGVGAADAALAVWPSIEVSQDGATIRTAAKRK